MRPNVRGEMVSGRCRVIVVMARITDGHVLHNSDRETGGGLRFVRCAFARRTDVLDRSIHGRDAWQQLSSPSAVPSPVHGIMTLRRGRIFAVVDCCFVVKIESKTDLSSGDETETIALKRDLALDRNVSCRNSVHGLVGRTIYIYIYISPCFWSAFTAWTAQKRWRLVACGKLRIQA